MHVIPLFLQIFALFPEMFAKTTRTEVRVVEAFYWCLLAYVGSLRFI
jgi:hypothetical protein